VYALSAAVAGLVVSSVSLGFAQRELYGTFFARYGVMVLVVCLGGVVLGIFLAYAGVWLYSSPMTTAERLLEVSSGLPLTIAAAGALGAAEGVVLAFPLAAGARSPGDRALTFLG
jgi:NhaP-type Na+/H+ or K+/H+ antiporter